jgi:hypothetical protein
MKPCRNAFYRLEYSLSEIIEDRRVHVDKTKRIYDLVTGSGKFVFLSHPRPSLLDFQCAMQWRRKRNNAETLFGVNGIPSYNQIRTLLNGIETKK